jgi:IS5 family transposase
LAVRLTAANVNDVTQLQVLVEAIPPLRGKRGRPRRRPEIVQADRGYDSQEHRVWLRQHEEDEDRPGREGAERPVELVQ